MSASSPSDYYSSSSSSSSKQSLTCSLGFSVDPSQLYTPSHLVSDMESWGYDYIECPLLAPDYDWKESLEDLKSTEVPMLKNDFYIQSSEFARCTVANIPQFLNFIKVGNDKKAHIASMKWKQLASWIGHLSLSTLQIPLPEKLEWQPEFARQVLSILTLLPTTSLWVQLDVSQPQALERWQLFQSIVGYQSPYPRCYLSLYLPTTPFPLLDSWLSEPVACLHFHLSHFDTNPKGYPMFSKSMRAQLQPWLSIVPYVTLHLDIQPHLEGPSIYKHYLTYLHRTSPVSAMDQFAMECQDVLQAPLQPLMHQLDMHTYDTFERDRIKYEHYQLAIEKALISKKQKGQKVIVLMVGMGARGPLVDCCLRASDVVQVPVFIYALEKNPNAFVTLQSKQKTVWGDDLVQVVFADMRSWKAPVLADLMVSELLGSFGDNELCPECLEGAQVSLKEDAISIPQSYSSHVALLSSSKLYSNALKIKDPTPLELSYVVKFKEVKILTSSQKAWEFTHPLPSKFILPNNQHNSRHTRLHFEVTETTTIHGFAGYFHCVLYDDVYLSIVPETHTKDMLSWFPMYFPVKEPMQVIKGDELTVHLWRCTNDKKVWYEWNMLLLRQGTYLHSNASSIHNSMGMSYWIGL